MRTKTYCLFFALFFISSSLFGQTIIKDKSYVSGTWKKSGSPYIIEGEAIVAIGKTLKIKPGVVIQFKTGDVRDYTSMSFSSGFLRVNGTLTAKGKAKKMILFRRKGSRGSWGCIQINDKTNKSVLSYCKVMHSHYIKNIVEDDNATGAISVYKSSPEIKNCVLVKNFWAAINCKENSAPLIKNSTIVGNRYGIECNSKSDPKIENTIVWRNKAAFYINNKSNPTITHSLVDEDLSEHDLIDDGTNIVDENPLFISVKADNYELRKNSPCRGKASNGRNIGAF
ncbi:MAG: right-handed parallel beta-helix repeat-containing protein [Aureispira sp.]|nr:right-handed parallel beta-helix repeat-containing protein [Aureispira sp.]